jgi:LEA14-like dessication related protein
MKSVMTKLLIGFLVLILGALALLNFLCDIEDFAPEIKEVTNSEILSIGEEYTEMEVTALLKNDNAFGILIENIDASVYDGEELLGTSALKGPIDLPSGEDIEITAPLSIITRQAAAMLNRGEDTVALTIRGTLDAEVSFVSKNIDFNLPYYLPIDDSLLSSISKHTEGKELISIRRAALESLGFKESIVNIYFNLNNPYDLPVTLIKYPADIYINGSYSGSGDLLEEIDLTAGEQSATGTVRFTLDNFQSLKSVLGTVLKRKLAYETRGTLYFRVFEYDIKIPYSFNGVLIQI